MYLYLQQATASPVYKVEISNVPMDVSAPELKELFKAEGKQWYNYPIG